MNLLNDRLLNNDKKTFDNEFARKKAIIKLINELLENFNDVINEITTNFSTIDNKRTYLEGKYTELTSLNNTIIESINNMKGSIESDIINKFLKISIANRLLINKLSYKLFNENYIPNISFSTDSDININQLINDNEIENFNKIDGVITSLSEMNKAINKKFYYKRFYHTLDYSDFYYEMTMSLDRLLTKNNDSLYIFSVFNFNKNEYINFINNNLIELKIEIPNFLYKSYNLCLRNNKCFIEEKYNYSSLTKYKELDINKLVDSIEYFDLSKIDSLNNKISTYNFLFKLNFVKKILEKPYIKLNSNATNFLTSITYNPDDNEYICVGWNGTILKSIDNGNTWIRLSSNTNNHLYSITYNPDDNEYICVGNGGTILKSIDSGNTWNKCNSNTNITLKSIVYNPNNKEYIIVGLNGFILKSIDNGNTWNRLYSSNPDYLFSIVYNPNNKIYICVGLNGIIIKSTNNGNTWIRLDNITNRTLYSITYNPKNNEYICVGQNGFILKSTDDGNTWSRLDSNTDNSLLSIVYNPDNNEYICAATNGTILKSTNNGNTWIKCKNKFSDQLNSIIYTPNNKEYICVGSSGIISKSDNNSNIIENYNSLINIKLKFNTYNTYNNKNPFIYTFYGNSELFNKMCKNFFFLNYIKLKENFIELSSSQNKKYINNNYLKFSLNQLINNSNYLFNSSFDFDLDLKTNKTFVVDLVFDVTSNSINDFSYKQRNFNSFFYTNHDKDQKIINYYENKLITDNLDFIYIKSKNRNTFQFYFGTNFYFDIYTTEHKNIFGKTYYPKDIDIEDELFNISSDFTKVYNNNVILNFDLTLRVNEYKKFYNKDFWKDYGSRDYLKLNYINIITPKTKILFKNKIFLRGNGEKIYNSLYSSNTDTEFAEKGFEFFNSKFCFKNEQFISNKMTTNNRHIEDTNNFYYKHTFSDNSICEFKFYLLNEFYSQKTHIFIINGIIKMKYTINSNVYNFQYPIIYKSPINFYTHFESFAHLLPPKIGGDELKYNNLDIYNHMFSDIISSDVIDCEIIINKIKRQREIDSIYYKSERAISPDITTKFQIFADSMLFMTSLEKKKYYKFVSFDNNKILNSLLKKIFADIKLYRPMNTNYINDFSEFIFLPEKNSYDPKFKNNFLFNSISFNSTAIRDKIHERVYTDFENKTSTLVLQIDLFDKVIDTEEDSEFNRIIALPKNINVWFNLSMLNYVKNLDSLSLFNNSNNYFETAGTEKLKYHYVHDNFNTRLICYCDVDLIGNSFISTKNNFIESKYFNLNYNTSFENFEIENINNIENMISDGRSKIDNIVLTFYRIDDITKDYKLYEINDEYNESYFNHLFKFHDIYDKDFINSTNLNYIYIHQLLPKYMKNKQNMKFNTNYFYGRLNNSNYKIYESKTFFYNANTFKQNIIGIENNSVIISNINMYEYSGQMYFKPIYNLIVSKKLHIDENGVPLNLNYRIHKDLDRTTIVYRYEHLDARPTNNDSLNNFIIKINLFLNYNIESDSLPNYVNDHMYIKKYWDEFDKKYPNLASNYMKFSTHINYQLNSFTFKDNFITKYNNLKNRFTFHIADNEWSDYKYNLYLKMNNNNVSINEFREFIELNDIDILYENQIYFYYRIYKKI